jgi:hypothetical protein
MKKCSCEESLVLREIIKEATELVEKLYDETPNTPWSDAECELLEQLDLKLHSADRI